MALWLTARSHNEKDKLYIAVPYTVRMAKTPVPRALLTCKYKATIR